MITPYFFYADETSLAVIESQAEKVLLIGGDFNARNFGDILQQVNTIALHQGMGRRNSVPLMGMGAVSDAQFPALVRASSGADALLFFSASQSDDTASELGLIPVNGACNVSCIHLYGGGFLNEKWGDIVLDVTEHLLRALAPPLYVVSGQQITAPYQGRVAEHIRAYGPALFGVRDTLSQQWLSSTGQSAYFSFDDATETLQQLTRALPLQLGPGLLLQLNVSDYTGNATSSESLLSDLDTLVRHPVSSNGLTVLQAYSDSRTEILDSRESIKYLERAFPFPDYRTLELSQLAYLSSGALARPVQGEVGYSCSYHVALWLQLAGIPCWLRGSNDFYAQKRDALQVGQTLEAFLHEPRLSDHRANIERRQAWIRLLTLALDAAPTSMVMREFGCLEESTSQLAAAKLTVRVPPPASFQSFTKCIPVESNMDATPSTTNTLALNQQITELGHLAHEYRARAETAEAELSDLRNRPSMLVDDTVRLRLEVNTLTQAIAQKDAAAHDLQQQVATLTQNIAQTTLEVNTLTQAIAQKDAAAHDLQQQVATLTQNIAQTTLEVNTLTQAIAQKDAAAHDLQQQVATLAQNIAQTEAALRDHVLELLQSRSEAASLFRQLDQVLHSHSWRLTRPLRVALRFVRHGHLDAAGDVGVFQLARYVGRRLPFPIGMKAWVRSALIQWRFRGSPHQPAPATSVVLLPRSIEEASFEMQAGQSMRAEHCALRPGLVSVVLPVFNQAYLLDESIQSVLRQTYQDFELIIINDGSTDDVESVLGKYINHPNVRCYTQANQRLPKALSNGFTFAKGEFWTWTSADNIMEPKMLEMLVGKLCAEPDLGMVYADYCAIDDRGALLQDTNWRSHNRPDPKSGAIRLPHTTENLNIIQDNFIGPCFMYRGWIGHCMGDYDPQLGIEDYDYWMRINAFFPIRHLGTTDLLYRYRVHDNTLSAQASEHRILEKVQRLMDYERTRATFYKRRYRIVADAVGMKWLQNREKAECDLIPLVDSYVALCLDEIHRADLVILSSESAVTHMTELVALTTSVAVLLESDERHHQKLQRLFNRQGTLAVANNHKAAARVRLVATCPIVDDLGSQALTSMLAFSRNQQYFRETRTPQELARQLPTQMIQPDNRHVLLQVDDFMQGGMENVVIDLALSLQDAGYAITVGVLGKSGDAANKAREMGLRVEPLPGGRTEDEYLAWLKERAISLVNAHYSIFGAAACKRASIPFIETIHNAYVWFDPETVRHYREADLDITSYICVSNTAAQYADVVLGLDVTKMRVVPNGIDSNNVDTRHFEDNRVALRQQWNVKPEATVFLNVASIMATKAQLPLVRAFAHVVKRHPDARLVLLGSVMEKPYQRAIEQAVKDHQLQDHVIFAGYQREVARYYHAADVFVLPSYWEGWSLSLGEAIANGLPCVITDVGSAYEFEGRNNIQILAPPFGDITQLNFLNIGEFVYREDKIFDGALAKAMNQLIGNSRNDFSSAEIDLINRDRAYFSYASIFSTLLLST
jgi:glycosyltransferase involved in cell wall biosynthesis